MDLTFIIILLASIGSGIHWNLAANNKSSLVSLIIVLCTFFLVTYQVYIRGQAAQQCPINSVQELLIFISWSILLFYLVIGKIYRLSFLGLLTLPAVALFEVLGLIPSLQMAFPSAQRAINPILEWHVFLLLLAYGALGQAALAGVLFLQLHRVLKKSNFSNRLFSQMPPIGRLSEAIKRLLWLGFSLLTIGIILGFKLDYAADSFKFYLACGTWVSYFVLIIVDKIRGLPLKLMSIYVLALYILNLILLVSI